MYFTGKPLVFGSPWEISPIMISNQLKLSWALSLWFPTFKHNGMPQFKLTQRVWCTYFCMNMITKVKLQRNPSVQFPNRNSLRALLPTEWNLVASIDAAFTAKFPSFYCVIKQNSYLRITPFRGWHRWNIHKTIKQQKCNHWDAQKLHCSGPGANWGSMCSYGSHFPSFSGTTSTVSFWKPFFALGTIRHDRSISVSLKIFILSVNPRLW